MRSVRNCQRSVSRKRPQLCREFGWVSDRTIRSTGPLPKSIRFRRFPGADVDSVGNVRHGNFPLRPARKQAAEQTAAHLAMQTADAIDAPLPRTAR